MKHTIIIIFSIGLLLSSCNNKTKNNIADFTKKYEGSIGGKYSIVVNLHKNAKNELSGTYFYKTIKTNIELKGNITEGKTTLNGFDNFGNNIDLFVGTFSDDFSELKGDWSKPDGSRTMEFSIKEVMKPGKDKNESSNDVIIETVTVKETHLKDICLTISESKYPKINGSFDIKFLKKLNNLFSNNFNKFIERAKKEDAGCIGSEDTYENSEMYPHAYGDFKVLPNNNNIISVIQHMTSDVGNMGNFWMPESFVVTADLKNKVIWGKKEFDLKSNQIDFINKKIKKYFNEIYPKDKDILSYPLIENLNDFNNMKLGVRNDSIMLVVDTNPVGYHAGLGTYIIPIDKIKQ